MVFIIGTNSNFPSYIFSLITAYLKAIWDSSLLSSNRAPEKGKNAVQSFSALISKRNRNYYAILAFQSFVRTTLPILTSFLAPIVVMNARKHRTELKHAIFGIFIPVIVIDFFFTQSNAL